MCGICTHLIDCHIRKFVFLHIEFTHLHTHTHPVHSHTWNSVTHWDGDTDTQTQKRREGTNARATSAAAATTTSTSSQTSKKAEKCMTSTADYLYVGRGHIRYYMLWLISLGFYLSSLSNVLLLLFFECCWANWSIYHVLRQTILGEKRTTNAHTQNGQGERATTITQYPAQTTSINLFIQFTSNVLRFGLTQFVWRIDVSNRHIFCMFSIR